MYSNRRNFRAFKEIAVHEHDGDVIFKMFIWGSVENA